MPPAACREGGDRGHALHKEVVTSAVWDGVRYSGSRKDTARRVFECVSSIHRSSVIALVVRASRVWKVGGEGDR